MWVFNPPEPVALPLRSGFAIGMDQHPHEFLAAPPVLRILDVELEDQAGLILFPRAAGTFHLFRDFEIYQISGRLEVDLQIERYMHTPFLIDPAQKLVWREPPILDVERVMDWGDGYVWHIGYDVQHILYRTSSGINVYSEREEWTMWFGPPGSPDNNRDGDPYIIYRCPDGIGHLSLFDPMRAGDSRFDKWTMAFPRMMSEDLLDPTLFKEFPEQIELEPHRW